MTHKLQISKKYNDGTIIVVGGDDIGEWSENYEQFMNALEEKGLIPSASNAETLVQEARNLGGEPKTDTTSFEVTNIKLASGGDHPRWVVQGGHFTKFGVTCWPEVLKEANIYAHLDPMKDNTPQGKWVAHYIEKEDGKPDKVTRLEKI